MAHDWREHHFRLFLSHAEKGKALAGGIRQSLLPNGVDAFVAHDLIEATREWQDDIESALRTCEALVAIITEDVSTSQWCDQEIGHCWGRGIPVITVRQGAAPHGFIGKYQAVPGDSSSEVVAGRILDTLRSHPETRVAVAQAYAHQVVTEYASSFSFDQARRNLERLKTIPAEGWTQELANAVENAATQNDQIASAYYSNTTVSKAASAHLDKVLERTPTEKPDQVPS